MILYFCFVRLSHDFLQRILEFYIYFGYSKMIFFFTPVVSSNGHKLISDILMNFQFEKQLKVFFGYKAAALVR